MTQEEKRLIGKTVDKINESIQGDMILEKRQEDKCIVFAAVGFETTAPLYAALPGSGIGPCRFFRRLRVRKSINWRKNAGYVQRLWMPVYSGPSHGAMHDILRGRMHRIL